MRSASKRTAAGSRRRRRRRHRCPAGGAGRRAEPRVAKQDAKLRKAPSQHVAEPFVALDDDETLGRNADLEQGLRHAAGSAAQFDHHVGAADIDLFCHGAGEIAARRSDGADAVRRPEPAPKKTATSGSTPVATLPPRPARREFSRCGNSNYWDQNSSTTKPTLLARHCFAIAARYQSLVPRFVSSMPYSETMLRRPIRLSWSEPDRVRPAYNRGGNDRCRCRVNSASGS